MKLLAILALGVLSLALFGGCDETYVYDLDAITGGRSNAGAGGDSGPGGASEGGAAGHETTGGGAAQGGATDGNEAEGGAAAAARDA